MNVVVRNGKTKAVLAERAEVAHSLIDRTIGLIGRKTFVLGDGLVLPSCRSVHTCFMSYPIDLVFLTDDLTVSALQENVKPWRFSKIIFNAKSVLELPGGAIRERSINVGDQLEIVSSE